MSTFEFIAINALYLTLFYTKFVKIILNRGAKICYVGKYTKSHISEFAYQIKIIEGDLLGTYIK